MSSKILKQFVGAILLMVLISALSLAQDTAKPSEASSWLIDINTASKKELTTLPSINEARAQKIIDGRPYKNKGQLKARMIINEAEYNTIKDRIIAKLPKK